MSILIGVQARLGSTRFPSKVLAQIGGRTMVAHVVAAAVAAAKALGLDSGSVRLLPPGGIDCEIIGQAHERQCVVLGISGDPDDVIGRFYHLVGDRSGRLIVRLTGDCPLLDPALIAQVVRLLIDTGVEYASNDTRDSGYPDGLDVEGFTGALLARAYHEASSPADREHVGPWMQRTVPWVKLMAPADLRGFVWPKLSVDTPADLDRVRLVHAELNGATGVSAIKAAIERLRAKGVADV